MRRGRRGALGKFEWAFLGALAIFAVAAAGCSSSANSATSTYVASGQIPQADRPAGGAHGAHVNADAVTIPLAKQNPTTALFSAVATFQSCLSGRGVTFQGAPDPKNPNSPANDPSYVKNLVACAAQSKILQALKAAQSAQDNLTPKQVKTENNDYLKWRKCMQARGWGIPTPTPNAKGLLFSFGGTGGSSMNFTPPAGQSIISSPDLQACAAKAQGESS
jgi:hypothetical protein